VVVSTKPRLIVFENTNQASLLARQIRDHMDKLIDDNYSLVKDHETTSAKTKKLVFDGTVVDTGVYKKTQNMRLVYHIKNGSDEPFVPEDDGDIKNYIITDISDNPDIIKSNEQDDELYATTSDSMNLEMSLSQTDIDIIIEKVKKIHPTAFFDRQDSSGYLQFNYTDRKEPCFTRTHDENIKHDQIGFFVYVANGIIYSGCHSGNCVSIRENNKGEEEIKKSIKNLGYLKIAKPSSEQPVDYSEIFSIDFDLICENIQDGAQGLAALFREMYLSPKRIKSQVSSGGKGAMDIFYWNGKIWKEDDRGFIDDIISTSLKKLLQDFIFQANSLPGQALDEYIIKEARTMVDKLKNNMFSPSIMKSIRPYLDDKPFSKNKDIHPYMLSCKNGMVDLRTGDIRKSLPEDNITKTIGTEYLTTSDSSDFEKFIRQITSSEKGENPEVYDFFKWCIGYALQGAPKKKLFLLLYGPHGFNGKSLVMNTIKDTLENYADAMDSSVVLDNGSGKSPGSHSTELMQLENCRLGILSDTPEDACINDGRMKQLTGGTDTISGREIYGKQRDFKPVFVPFINTNHIIRINLADMAMYERLILFPFVLSFVDNPSKTLSYQRKADNDLAEKLNTNKEGVLKWLIEASIYYHKDPNKSQPEYLLKAKEDYNKQVNTHKGFVEDRIRITQSPEDTISKKKLLLLYKEYVTANGGLKYYKPALSEREFDRLFKTVYKGIHKHYTNIKIVEEEPEPEPEVVDNLS
jgi:putative DNA primase/helicase